MVRRRSGLKRNVRTRQREEAVYREALERRWFSRMEMASEFGPLVVQDGRMEEPFHRWLPYRQGFSPALVRRVIADGELAEGPLLDPFCGGGTTLVEASRMGCPCAGVEALPSLAFLANARFLPPESADAPIFFDETCTSLELAWQAADSDLARAAVLCAAARTVMGDGRPVKNVPSDRILLDQSLAMMREDMETPLEATGQCVCGDARKLPFEDGSVGGILTSPPYLSRYDYTRVTRPMELLFSGEAALDVQQKRQIRAHHRAHGQAWQEDAHPAIREACERLVEEDRKKEAGIVRSYAEDMRVVMTECERVLAPGAPMIVVVTSVLFGKVYVPSDCVLIDYCAQMGMDVEEILVARTFTDHGPALGSLKSVPPREIIFTVRKPS